MRVEHYERGRYFVESESKPGEFYLVDLLERGRLGSCDCRDYDIRIQAAIDRGDKPVRPYCKHIAAVRSAVGDADRIAFLIAAFEAHCERYPLRIVATAQARLGT